MDGWPCFCSSVNSVSEFTLELSRITRTRAGGSALLGPAKPLTPTSSSSSAQTIWAAAMAPREWLSETVLECASRWTYSEGEIHASTSLPPPFNIPVLYFGSPTEDPPASIQARASATRHLFRSLQCRTWCRPSSGSLITWASQSCMRPWAPHWAACKAWQQQRCSRKESVPWSASVHRTRPTPQPLPCATCSGASLWQILTGAAATTTSTTFPSWA